MVSRAELGSQGPIGGPLCSIVAAVNSSLAVKCSDLLRRPGGVTSHPHPHPCVPGAKNLPGGDTRARGSSDGLPLCSDAQLQPPPHVPACQLVTQPFLVSQEEVSSSCSLDMLPLFSPLGVLCLWPSQSAMPGNGSGGGGVTAPSLSFPILLL